MFGNSWGNNPLQVKKRIILRIVGIVGVICLMMPGCSQDQVSGLNPESLIRFHVIANSDSEEDQILKYAVRDEILKKVAPVLAQSGSLDESRRIIQDMEREMLDIADTVMKERGKDYSVTMDYGIHTFPTKSYGNTVLPAGEYEAVKIKIGKAQGANWWCVLFPPLCFVNVEESTTLPVDGKPGVPIDSSTLNSAALDGLTYKGKKVGFFFERFF